MELWNRFGSDLRAACEGASNKLVFRHSPARVMVCCYYIVVIVSTEMN